MVFCLFVNALENINGLLASLLILEEKGQEGHSVEIGEAAGALFTGA